jgi:flagellar hook-length control protein FliK
MSGMVQTESVSYEATTQTITMESGEQVDVSRIIEQIVEQTKTVITDEITTVEMVLRPEGLGKLLMQVSEQEGNVTAHIYTQNEEVKEALENQMVMLKEQLNQGGTKVNSIEVSVATHEFERNLEEGQQERGQEEAPAQESKKARNINLNNLDELSGLMTEEEELVAKMMRDNGNTVNYRV